MDIPVDTGRKLNVHKTFRRRAGLRGSEEFSRSTTIFQAPFDDYLSRSLNSYPFALIYVTNVCACQFPFYSTVNINISSSVKIFWLYSMLGWSGKHPYANTVLREQETTLIFYT